MSDIVAPIEAAKTIESLRAELAKVNMEVDRLTRTNQAKREHRDKLLKAGVKAAARIEKLEAALREIMELPGELNPCNYDYDDVVALNDAFCAAYSIARAALEDRT